MGRYRHKVYENSTTPRWVAVFGLQWQVIESYRLEPGADLFGAMTTTIARLAIDGWRPESEPRFGFVFISRESDRRLLMQLATGMSQRIEERLARNLKRRPDAGVREAA